MDGADFGGPAGLNGVLPVSSEPDDLPFPLTQSQRARASRMSFQDRVTRILDVVLSASALIVLSPLLAAIAIGVRRDGAGPSLFRQQRYGRGGRTFDIYKFRTMWVMESRGGYTPATMGDARVTRFGLFLRKASLDELPQLFNVLKGEMSLVGPRPHPLQLDRTLAEGYSGYGDRFTTRPGITGLAQVRGFRGEIQDKADARGRVLNDVLYARKRGLGLYICILVLTPFVVFFQRKAY